jgi:hypothetical protein
MGALACRSGCVEDAGTTRECSGGEAAVNLIRFGCFLLLRLALTRDLKSARSDAPRSNMLT